MCFESDESMRITPRSMRFSILFFEGQNSVGYALEHPYGSNMGHSSQGWYEGDLRLLQEELYPIVWLLKASGEEWRSVSVVA